MININKGRNPELARKSKTLNGYAIFVAKVREYEKKYTFDEALKLATEYCKKNSILEDYFKNNPSEVVRMNFTKFNVKDAMKVAREEGIEKGKKEGEQKVLDLMEQGLTYEEIKKKIEKTSKKPKRA